MDVVVIGAGVVGCAIAYELAGRGARVRVIDGRGAGAGATRAAAGMLAPHVEGHLELGTRGSGLGARIPSPGSPGPNPKALRALGVRSLALYDDFVRRVTTDSGQTVEYERAGTLQVAFEESEAAELCALARALAGTKVDHILLDAGEARRLEPALSGRVVRALHVREQGYVAAEALTRALASAAIRQGAEIVTDRVASIEGGGTPRVVTSGGTLEADAVIVAAGSWSAGLFAARSADQHAVKPIRGQIVQVRLESRPAAHILWGARCYLVPWRDGTVLVGATSEDVGFDETSTAAGVRQLLAAGAELMPGLDAAVFEDVRVGLRPMTPDELPAIGPSSTHRGVFYATGHYRNGILLAPLTAALVADLVIEGREGPELALVRPARLGL